jgi:signal transduction histidine kinase
VAKFAISGAVTLLLLGFAAVALLRHATTHEAIHDAQQSASLAGNGVVGPGIPSGLLRGDPAAVSAMDRLVRRSVLRGPVVRVKIWDRHGRIVYSDEPRLIGSRYPLHAQAINALRTGRARAGVSDLSEAENRFERGYDKLLEVYVGVRGPNGEPFLFESYQRFSAIGASGRREWLEFLPALVGGLILLELAQIPLAWSLARRVERGQRDREQLLRGAIEASALERQRVARDLHDRVLPELAGIGHELTAVEKEMPAGAPWRAPVGQSALRLRATARGLRALLLDMYPPTLDGGGLEGELSELLAEAEKEGIETRLSLEPGLELSDAAEALVFRAAQETLQNVRRHSHARHVLVAVAAADGHAVLEVVDDGRGFDPALEGQRRNGHLGLLMLSDLARQGAADLRITSAHGHGTLVRLEVPVR